MNVLELRRENSLHVRNLVTSSTGRKLAFKGTVASEPLFNSFSFKVSEVYRDGSWHPARGIILLRSGFTRINFGYGDYLKLRAHFFIPASPRNPGEFDWQSYLARKNIHVLGNLSPDSMEFLGEGWVNPLVKFSYILKKRMELIIRKTISPPQSFFLESVLLGNRYLLSSEWREAFVTTGTAHLISISGLHVGFVVIFIITFLKVLRLPGKVSAFITIAAVICYCILTGARPPAIRASIMAVMILSGFLLDRPVKVWNSLFVAAFIIIILNPLELFDPGFQMSFIAVAGILYIQPVLEAMWNLRQRLARYCWKSATVIAAAQIAVLPLIVYYFNIFPLMSLLSNFAVVPVFGLVVGVGFFSCISGLIWVGIAQVFNAANSVFITAIFRIVKFFSLPAGSHFYVASPPVYLIIAYYLVIFLVFKLLVKSQGTPVTAIER